MMKFSDILSEIMINHQLSQKELAKKVGLTQSAISKYLNAQIPSYEIAIKILNTFNYQIINNNTQISDVDIQYQADKKVILDKYYHLKEKIKEEFGPEYL